MIHTPQKFGCSDNNNNNNNNNNEREGGRSFFILQIVSVLVQLLKRCLVT